jgi:uncharacterized FAD-dependent dehydrogenase
MSSHTLDTQHIIIELTVDPRERCRIGEKAALEAMLVRMVGIVVPYSIMRRSIDARKKRSVVWHYRCLVEIDSQKAIELVDAGFASYSKQPQVYTAPEISRRPHAIIVGSGPAGLFCALRLIESGSTVTLFERGKQIGERDDDVRLLKEKGELDPESNVVFGEGGAGTYSDGKLTTRIHRGPIEYVLEKLVMYGAPSSIMYDAKPHIGTDVLSRIIRAMREEIVSRGGDVRFGERVTGIIHEQSRAAGVNTASGKEYRGDMVVLATGHSARDVYEMLYAQGISLEKKGFSVGFRIEHPAAFINMVQYDIYTAYLPAADYRLAYHDLETKRGVYSFCMCPGGEVINSSSEQGFLCVNGMSHSARDAIHSNAAIVVTVGPDDLPDDPRAGIYFQRTIEKRAFDCGGGGFRVPAQSAILFGGKNPGSLHDISYRPGAVPSQLTGIFPEWITEPLIRGLSYFDQCIPGFLAEGICIGAETRTSSPVRITRGATMESVNLTGLYPIGEGAGYAGGIVSSAVDGVRCADMIVSEVRKML